MLSVYDGGEHTNGRDCDRVFTQNADAVSVAYVSYRWSGGVLYGADVTVILPSGGGTSIRFSAACGGGSNDCGDDDGCGMAMGQSKVNLNSSTERDCIAHSDNFLIFFPVLFCWDY